jgi:formylmethanofuran dehydrogenase subunit E
MTNQRGFEKLIEESVKLHGHLCPGQVLGIRMAMYGIEKVGIHDPKGRDKKKLYLFVEIDRCATDALRSVTGCSLGHRTMRFMDFGKMAATFVNLETGISVRVVAKEDAREKAKNYFPEIKDKHQCQLEAYKIMSDEELFYHEPVYLNIPEQDMPGRPLRRVRCEECGEYVQDMRDVYRDGKIMCRPCANGEIYFYTFRYPKQSQRQEKDMNYGQTLSGRVPWNCSNSP